MPSLLFIPSRAASLAEPETVDLPAGQKLADLSYSAQYDRLFQKELDTKKVCCSLLSTWLH